MRLHEPYQLREYAAIMEQLMNACIQYDEMKGDRELCTAAVAQNWRALKYVSEEMKGDRELCIAAVTQNGLALEHASPEMKDDIEVVRAAFQQMRLDIADKLMKDTHLRWFAAVRQKGE